MSAVKVSTFSAACGSSISTLHVVTSGCPSHLKPSASFNVPEAKNFSEPVSNSGGDCPIEAVHFESSHTMVSATRKPRWLKVAQSMSDRPMHDVGAPTTIHWPSSAPAPRSAALDATVSLVGGAVAPAWLSPHPRVQPIATPPISTPAAMIAGTSHAGRLFAPAAGAAAADTGAAAAGGASGAGGADT